MYGSVRQCLERQPPARMSNRSALTSIAALALCAAAACNDGSVGTVPKVPPGTTQPVGMIVGSVVGDKMTAEFTPMGSAGAMIYGSNATVKVSGTLVSLVNNPPVNRTWTFNVHMRNLLAFPIGSNYRGTNPTPPDTSGVFVAFVGSPVVTLPVPCAGCTATVTNAMGTANFGSPGQKYFWYRNRPTAVQGSPGTDTTSNATWVFVGAPFRPATGDTTHAFTFSLIVSAAWPPANEPVFTTIYDGTNDSEPDLKAEPRYKKFHFQAGTAAESWTGAGLLLTSALNTDDIDFSRHDSLGNQSAYIEATVTVTSASAGRVAGILGLAEPAGGQQMAIAITGTRAEFGTIANATGIWTQLAFSPTFAVASGTSHKYRLRKIGTATVAVCVDGVQRFTGFYSGVHFFQPVMQATQGKLSGLTSFFGLEGRTGVGGAQALYGKVTTVVGSDGGGC